MVWVDDAGKLDYAEGLVGIGKDARLILSRELRHSILKLTAAPAATGNPGG